MAAPLEAEGETYVEDNGLSSVRLLSRFAQRSPGGGFSAGVRCAWPCLAATKALGRIRDAATYRA